jgi:protein involved in polysaccharide export with SLBB domain
MIKHVFYLYLVILIFALSNCAGVDTANIPKLTKQDVGEIEFADSESADRKFVEPDVWKDSSQRAASDYIIQLGDVIDIKIFGHPELNQKLRVRPDGKISLQLMGETGAIGLTPSELGEVIKTKYSKWFYHLNVAVIIQDFAGYKVYVGGEVRLPGLVTTFGNIPALEAIFMSGGFKDTAHPESVIIIRKGSDNQPHVRKLNLTAALSGKASEQNLLLKPFDVLYVPKSAVAKANLFVEQYITKMLPGTLHAGFSYVITDPKSDPGINVNLPGAP